MSHPSHTPLQPHDRADYLLLDNQLCFALYAASKKIINMYRPLLDKLGITYTQYIVLLVLWESSPISFKQLGERLFLDSGTLTPVLKKLDKKGVIIRTRSEDDERQLIVALTESGRKLKQAAYAIPEQMICKVPFNIEDAFLMRDKLKEFLQPLESI